MNKKSQKQLDRELEKERQQRLAFIGTLAAGLAHEIRSPLNAISLNLKLLEEDAEKAAEPLADDLQKRIHRVQQEVDWLKEFLSEFLNFARPPKPKRFPTDLNALIRETVEFIQPDCDRRQVRVHLDLADTHFPLLIDRNQIGHGVLLNLVTNALDAIGQIGDIWISTRESGDRTDWVEITVEDNGGGVDPEVGEQVFDIFYSTKPHGTGLGLGIARRIMEEHGGSLTLENVPGVKAVFHARLPQSRILDHNPT